MLVWSQHGQTISRQERWLTLMTRTSLALPYEHQFKSQSAQMLLSPINHQCSLSTKSNDNSLPMNMVQEPSTQFKVKRNWCETTIAISQSTKEAPGWRQHPRNVPLPSLKQLTKTGISSNNTSLRTHNPTPRTKMLLLPSWCKNSFQTNHLRQPQLLPWRDSR